MRQATKAFRIAIDRRSIGWSAGTGIARYREALARALAEMGALVEPIGDGGAPGRGVLADLPRTVRRVHRAGRDGEGWKVPDLYRLCQRHFTLTGGLLDVAMPDPPPLVHWSHPMPVRVAGAVNLYTIHDLIPIEAPDLTGIPARRTARLIQRLADSGNQFVTVSETVRAALIQRYGLPEDRVTCCYQAPEIGVVGELPAPLVRGGYLLTMGRVESRKNIVRLLRALALSKVSLPLVIAGPEGHWRSHAERAEAEALMRAQGVIRLGWQADSVAAALITHARALLMPSLAEGFGLPAIEAMRAGVPAMVSGGGAAEEIAGGAALVVDPLDTVSIASGIARLHDDEGFRGSLIARGLSRAGEFGAESFALRLSRLYERFV